MTPKISIRTGIPPLYMSKTSEVYDENTGKQTSTENEVIDRLNLINSIKKKRVAELKKMFKSTPKTK